MAMNVIPTWPGDTVGPRVLLECEDASIQDGAERALRENGYAVAVCNGPATRSSGLCTLVTDGRCGLIDDADVVVHALDPDRDEHCEVLSAIRQHRPDTPVVVEVSNGADMRDPALLAAMHHVRYPMTRESLLAAVQAATTRNSGSPPTA
jgi:CheY-like chemotaxis protein